MPAARPSPFSTAAIFLGAAFVLTAERSAAAADWPAWRGPERDGLCRETGLLKAWPKGGPPLALKVDGLGEGYSSVAVAGGKVFTMGNRGRTEHVIALDAKDGKEAWATEVGAVRSDGSGYPGPRCTPTVDGAVLYALGINGDLLCLETGSGKEKWRKDLQREFQGRIPGWGYSESPLIDGDRVLVTPGGREATIVALKKDSGDLVWKSSIPRGNREEAHGTVADKLDGVQYSSIIEADFQGRKQYIQFLSTGVAAISAEDGKFLWRYNKSANGTANITTPIYKDGFVFTASGYGTGGGLVQLKKTKDGIDAHELQFTKRMKNHHGGVVLVGDHLYGFDEGVLRCLEFKTLKPVWENRSVGKGSVLYADGHIYCRSESGPLALVEANPQNYVEKGRFDQPHRSGKNAWPHPVISGGRLYLRDQDVLLVYAVGGKK